MRKTFTLKWTFLATLGDYIVNHSQPGEDNFNTSSDIFFYFSITVYIQYYFALVPDVQFGVIRQSHTLQSGPLIFLVPTC